MSEWIGPLFAEPRGRGWYIADAEMRDVRGVIFISKRAAVASIRAMPEATGTGYLARAPFLYGKRIRKLGCRLGQRGLVGEELQPPGLVAGGQPFEEQATEEACEHPC